MAYRHLSVEPSAKPPTDAHIPSVSYFNRAAVLILVMFLLVLTSACGQSAVTGTAGKETTAVGSSQGKTTADSSNQSKSTIDSAAKQQTKAPSQLEQADAYFKQGNYDAALNLYRGINTDYAQRQVHAIECITVSQEVAQEWLSEVDDEIANGIILAAFGLDFEFDTDYDVGSYTFYTKMAYPELYTSIAAASGVSKQEIEEGVTSSGHEKIAYQLFYERGYKDITCISQMLDSGGNVLASYPYGLSEYEADLAKAAEETEAMQKKQETRENLEREFVANLDSNTEFCEAAYKYVKDYVSRDTSTFAADAGKYFNQNMADGSYVRDFRFVGEVQYGPITGAAPEKMAEELVEYNVHDTALLDYIVLHIPFSAKVAAEDGGDGLFFDVVYDFAIVADPEDSEHYISIAPYQAIRLISMERDESLTFGKLWDVPCPWLDRSIYSSADCSWGTVGESLSSRWVKLTVESVYSVSEYGDFKAGPNSQLIVASVSLENIHTSLIRLDAHGGLGIYWYSGRECAPANRLLSTHLIDVGEVCTGVLVYEVPKEVHNFAIQFHDGGLEAKTSMVGFSVGE